MNVKKFLISLTLILAVLFANTAVVFAYPADPPQSPRTLTTVSCADITANAARIDIPSRSTDYTTFNKLSDCGVIAGLNIIPVTGSRLDLGRQSYEDFKILQAEQMSK